MTKNSLLRQKRHTALRYKVIGTADRPRLSVYRSLRGMYAQAIDDNAGSTLASGRSYASRVEKQNGIERATSFGNVMAETLKTQKITRVVFDRGGFRYHGQVQAFADSLRQNGIEI